MRQTDRQTEKSCTVLTTAGVVPYPNPAFLRDVVNDRCLKFNLIKISYGGIKNNKNDSSMSLIVNRKTGRWDWAECCETQVLLGQNRQLMMRAKATTTGPLDLPVLELRHEETRDMVNDDRVQARSRWKTGELDSHEEASPEEIKSREVVLG